MPNARRELLVVGTSCKKPASILRWYLDALASQEKPAHLDVLYVFVDDGLEPDARAMLEAFIQQHGGGIIEPVAKPIQPDFSDAPGTMTHQWSPSAMNRVGANKDQILQFALQNRADYVWLCDADLVCDRTTLTSLLSIPEPIVCAVYWTAWQRVPEGANPVCAGPQVWLTHPYGLAGHGMQEWEFRKKLIDRQAIPVFGQGACTLIRRDALLKGVCFAPIPENTGPGFMQGEDRHFCIRAERLHLRMIGDAWPDIFHIYHRPDDEQLAPAMAARLGTAHPDKPTSALDLVSLTLAPLEGVPTQQGYQRFPEQRIRGRLASLKLHPELEAAVLGMKRGETRIVPVHFPLSWPVPPYRGQRRLIKVTLHDTKPFQFPPVIDREILTSGHGWLDTTTFPPEAIKLIREVHEQPAVIAAEEVAVNG